MNTRPKIVQVALELQGGGNTAVEHFASALRPWSQESIVELSSHAEQAVSGRVRLQVAMGVLGRKYSWMSRVERAKGAAALDGADFVFIHVPYRYHADWASAWCREHGVPFAFVPHGGLDPYVFTYRAWQKRLWLRTSGGRMLRDAAFVLYATLGEAEKAERAIGRRPREILPWPTPAPAHVDRAGARALARASLGLPADARLLLFLGRLHPMKRPRETVEAFLAARMAGWHLVLAGPEETVTAAELRALGGPVHICGPVHGGQKEALLAGSDALVLFSHRENFGFVVTEALAYGTPVIVSNELDLAPELQAQGCGWVVDGSTAEGRLSALGELLPIVESEYCRRGAIGRDWVREEMSADRFASRLRAMVERAVASRSTDRKR